MKPNWDEKFKDVVHDENNIKGFCGEYRWLSNFEPCLIVFQGLTYTSSEAAYQSAKLANYEDRKALFTNLSASESKKLGRKIAIRPDWELIKDEVMNEILEYKFTDVSNSELKQKLIDTGTKYLEESNWWGDTYWGVCNGVGQNKLGKNLMQIRDLLNMW